MSVGVLGRCVRRMGRGEEGRGREGREVNKVIEIVEGRVEDCNAVYRRWRW